ncbi:MAG TPA: VTT domain-containing protein [Stellaceae bacterium]|jgi:membrane protein YqaA with SNARE-associated domain|nr:VTT domain-containing protein [Stellaceae bacterium]
MNLSVARGGWLRHVATLARHRCATAALAAIAFADSSFLPIPPDILLVPMALLRPERLRRLLVIGTVASSLGAVLGYLIGYGLWDLIGAPLIDFYGYRDAFAAYQNAVAVWGVWIIIAKAFTPIPFKVAAIGAGVAGMDPVAFMVATVLGRALHFAMVGLAIVLFGERVMAMVERFERQFAIVSVLGLAAVAVAFALK